MKTVIQQLIEEVKANMAGVGVSSNENGVSKAEKQWFQASYSTMSKILLDLEVNYLAMEKKQIQDSYIAGSWDTSGIQDENEMSNNYYQETFSDKVE